MSRGLGTNLRVSVCRLVAIIVPVGVAVVIATLVRQRVEGDGRQRFQEEASEGNPEYVSGGHGFAPTYLATLRTARSRTGYVASNPRGTRRSIPYPTRLHTASYREVPPPR